MYNVHILIIITRPFLSPVYIHQPIYLHAYQYNQSIKIID